MRLAGVLVHVSAVHSAGGAAQARAVRDETERHAEHDAPSHRLHAPAPAALAALDLAASRGLTSADKR
jgi:hypothetical protein